MKNTPKTILLAICLAIFVIFAFIGCAGTPTAFEQKLFDIKTNYVEVVTLRTNTIYETNTSVQTITVTNTQGVVVPITVTNFIPMPMYSLVAVTNFFPRYEYHPNETATSAQATAGGIGNIVAPGVGGPIASAVVGLILAGWSWLRSSRSTKTAVNSAQVIEAMRELLKSMPNGKQYDAVLVQWMQQHQADAGVLQNVLKILENNVDNSDAKRVAADLQSALAQLQVSNPPPIPTTPKA